jgi:hypothetical protein
MVFDRLLVEESVDNGGGFSSDYVTLSENAAGVQNGQRQFFELMTEFYPHGLGLDVLKYGRSG